MKETCFPKFVAANVPETRRLGFILIPSCFASKRKKKRIHGNEAVEDKASSEDEQTANTKENKQSMAKELSKLPSMDLLNKKKKDKFLHPYLFLLCHLRGVPLCPKVTLLKILPK